MDDKATILADIQKLTPELFCVKYHIDEAGYQRIKRRIKPNVGSGTQLPPKTVAIIDRCFRNGKGISYAVERTGANWADVAQLWESERYDFLRLKGGVKEKVIQQYFAGASVDALACDYNCSNKTIATITRKATHAAMLHDLSCGIPLQEIAEMYSITREDAAIIIRQHVHDITVIHKDNKGGIHNG